MAVLELYGKCKELGYCDCGGFFGCVDPNPPAPKPVIENELRNAMKAERETTDYSNHNYRRELNVIEEGESAALVECEVCDRSHAPTHPHIANIEGDQLVEDEADNEERRSQAPAPVAIDRELPSWLKDDAHSKVVSSAVGSDVRPDSLGRKQTRCDVCGLIERRNHRCRIVIKPEQSSQAAPDPRVADRLPEPVKIVQPSTPALEPDRELAAIQGVLDALKGLSTEQVRRVLAYVSDRKGINGD
jgi:hypothetical protein